MSTVKKSLEDNKAEILKALPKEFHANVDQEIAAACDQQRLSDDEEVEAIKKELTQNPDVNDAEVIPGFAKAPTAHKPLPLPSEAEQKKAMEQALAETTALIGK